MLLRLASLALMSLFSLVSLLPNSDVGKNLGIPALRYQLAILQRQIAKLRLTTTARALLTGLCVCWSRSCLWVAMAWRLSLVGTEVMVIRGSISCVRAADAVSSMLQRGAVYSGCGAGEQRTDVDGYSIAVVACV